MGARGKTLKAQTQLIRDLVEFVEPEIGRAGPVYEGEIAPGLAPLQERAIELGEQFLQGTSGDELRNAVSALLSGAPSFEYDPETSSELFRQAVAEPTMERWMQDILPAIEHRFGASGLQASGAREGFLRRSGVDLSKGLSAQEAAWQYGDLQAYRQALENAQGRLGTGIQMGLGVESAPITITSQLGGLQRSVQAQQNLDAYQKFLSEQPMFNPALGLIPMAMSFPGSLTAPPQAQNTTAGMLSGSLGLLGMGTSFLGPGLNPSQPMGAIASTGGFNPYAQQGGGDTSNVNILSNIGVSAFGSAGSGGEGGGFF